MTSDENRTNLPSPHPLIQTSTYLLSALNLHLQDVPLWLRGRIPDLAPAEAEQGVKRVDDSCRLARVSRYGFSLMHRPKLTTTQERAALIGKHDCSSGDDREACCSGRKIFGRLFMQVDCEAVMDGHHRLQITRSGRLILAWGGGAYGGLSF